MNLPNTNNNSLVLKASFGQNSFLFPGDIMADAEREMVVLHGDGLRSTFFTAPHHGSRTSSTTRFLEAMQPEWVIVSSGRKGSRYFPHSTIVDRYRKQGIRMLRTDTHGAIHVRIEPDAYTMITFRPVTKDLE